MCRSVGAVALGFVSVVALSLATDQILHGLDVYPPWGEPMRDPGLNALALAYRSIFAVLGSYLAARFAPDKPMKHALLLGVIGLVPSILGVVAATQVDLGPLWYLVALVVTAVPCAWRGGALYHRGQAPNWFFQPVIGVGRFSKAPSVSLSRKFLRPLSDGGSVRL